MFKRGQITIFIIVGILVLALSFVLFALFKESNTIVVENAYKDRVDTSSIELFVESCLSEVSTDALVYNSLRGGYLVTPEGSIGDLFEEVPYFYKDDMVLVPDNETITEQLALSIDSTLSICLDNFRIFREQGYNITFDVMKTQVKISENTFMIATNLNLVALQGTQKKELPFAQVSVDGKSLFDSLRLASTIALSNSSLGEVTLDQSQGNEPEFGFDVVEELNSVKMNQGLCLSCFENLADESGIIVNIVPTREDYVFDLRSQNVTKIGGQYHFRFAMEN